METGRSAPVVPPPARSVPAADTVRPETRRRYLTIAAELAHQDVNNEPAFAHLVAHIRLADVARHLGVSRSRLYRLWETQHDYWCDLAAFVTTRSEPWPDAPQVGQPTDDLSPGNLSPGDLDGLVEHLRLRFAPVQEHALADPYLVARAALAGYPSAPDLSARLATWHQARRQEASRRLAALLDASGRTPVAPLTPDDLAAAVWLMVVGLTLLARTEPEAHRTRLLVPPDRGGEPLPWTLLAYAVRSLLVELSRPTDRPRSSPPPPPAVSFTTAMSPTAAMSSTTAMSPTAAMPSTTAMPSTAAPADPAMAWSPDRMAALVAGAELFAASIDIADEAGTAGSGVVPRGPLGHVTLARVARAAGVSRRQLHHVWASQEDLSRDLIRFLRDRDHQEYFDQFDASVVQALEAPTLDTIGLEVVDRLFAIRLAPFSTATGAPAAHIALQPHLGDPLMREQSQRALDRLKAFQQAHIDALADLFGVRMRQGMTTEDLNRLIIAAANGSVALHHLDPTAIRRHLPYRGGNHSVLAIACQALIDHSVVT